MKERKYKYTKLIIIFLALSMFIFSRHNPLNETIYADTITTDIVVNNDEVEHEEVEQQEEQKLDEVEDNKEAEDSDQDQIQDEDINEEDLEEVEQQEEQKLVEVEDDKETEEVSTEDESLSTKEDAENQNTRALQSNETFVSSYEELRTLIESNGSSYRYDTFYLTSDIIANEEGINVPPGFTFTIDGTNPETLERFSFVQQVSEDEAKTILYSYNTATSITIQNVDIVGKNIKGVVSSRGSATVKYRNINYTGPSLSFISSGSVELEDSNITIENTESYSEISALDTKNLEITGINEVVLKDGASFLKNNDNFLNNGTLTIESTDQTVEVLTTKSFINYGKLSIDVTGHVDASVTNSVIQSDTFNNYGTINITSDTRLEDVFVIVNPFTTTGRINVEAHEVMDDIIRQSYLQTTEETELSGVLNVTVDYLGESIITSSALKLANLSMNVEIGSHGVEHLIFVETDITSDDSEINILITGTNEQQSKSMIKNANQFWFNNTKVNIDNEHNDYLTIFEAGSWSYFFTKADEYGGMSIKNGSETPSLVITSSGWIMGNQINHWTKIPGLDAYPEGDKMGASGHFIKNDSSFVSIQFSSTKNSTSISNSSATDADNTANFKAHGQAAYGIGRIYLEVDKNEDNGKKLRAKTNANSWVQIETEPRFNAYADSNGNVDADVSFNIRNGVYTITTFGGYLFDKKTIEYDVDGVLEFDKYPTQIDFGTVELLDGQKIYPRKSNNELVIYDGRKNKTGWKLSVYIKQDLFISGIDNSEISNAFAYDNQTKRLSNTPLVVYEMSGSNYDSEHVITWTEDSGLQLYIDNIYDVRLNQNYSAELVWILEEL